MRKVLIVLTVILIGLIGAFLGYRYVGPPGPGEVERIIQSPPGVIDPATARLYTTIKAGLTSLSAAIGIVLLWIYGNLYRKVRSEFTLGLMVATSALLVYAVTANPLFHRLVGGHTRRSAPGPSSWSLTSSSPWPWRCSSTWH